MLDLLINVIVAVAFLVVGWSTPEPAWAARLRVKLFGIASEKFREIEEKIRG
jgi:hypothetical protein